MTSSTTTHVTLTTNLMADVPNGGTVTLEYPAGFTQADFTGLNASADGRVVINNNEVYEERVSGVRINLTYGASSITLTNNTGLTWAFLSVLIVELGRTLSSGPAQPNSLDLLTSDQVLDTIRGSTTYPDGTKIEGPDGWGFVRDTSQPAWSANPQIVGWRPIDSKMNTDMIGLQSEITADYQGRVDQAIIDCARYGWEFHATKHAAMDGYSWIRPTLPNGSRLVLQFYPDAEFFPGERFQVFDTDGTQTEFELDPDVWDYQGDTIENTGAEFIASDGVTRTRLRKDTGHIAYNASTQTWTAFDPADTSTPPTDPLPAGGKLKIVSAKGAIEFLASNTARAYVEIRGHAKINISKGGVAVSDAGRSGIGFSGDIDVFQPGIVEVYGTEATGPKAAPIDQRGDSAVTYTGGGRYWATGPIRGRYLNDIGTIYMSGGGLAGSAIDDYKDSFFNLLSAVQCGTGCKDTRQGNGFHVVHLETDECDTVYVNAPQIGFAQGRNFRIDHIKCNKTHRRIADLRQVVGHGSIGSIQSTDFGFERDGTTVRADAFGVWFNESSGVIVENLQMEQKDWGTPTGRPAVGFEGTDGTSNQGNEVRGGFISGLDTAVIDSINTGCTTGGNVVRLRTDGVSTGLDDNSGDGSVIDCVVTDVDGPARNVWLTWEPNAFASGETAPTQTSSGEYIVDNHGVMTLAIQVNVSAWTPAGSGEIRIPFPAGWTRAGGRDIALSCILRSGIDVQALGGFQINGYSRDSTDFIVLQWSALDIVATQTGAIDGNDFSGTSIIFDVSGQIRVQPT